MEYLEVDGSYGEGGGQILRSALAFSAIMKKPVRVVKVRAGRKVPGLRRQHVSALRVFAEVFSGELGGAVEGSPEVRFIPGEPKTDSISLDMRTAASITLVLQAVIPAVALSRSRLSIELVGGTDVPWSPTFDYFSTVVREAFDAIGVRFTAEAQRRGYYPRGGGRVKTEIEPSDSIDPTHFVERPPPGRVNLVSRCAMLPRHVAERQLQSATSFLDSSGIRIGTSLVATENADSPGSSILLSAVGRNFFIGTDAIGERGRPAEEIGRDPAERFASTIESGACVDANLADMIAPLLSLAPATSELRVPKVSAHLETGFYLAGLFTGCKFTARAEGPSSIVSITPG